MNATAGGPRGRGRFVFLPENRVMAMPILHVRKQVLFALLSVADFALTWWLLDRPGAAVYESNPVAGWWLARFGWLGLACFKATVVLVVLGLAMTITHYRPRAAGLVLHLGCACLALVVTYSAVLACNAPGVASDATHADYLKEMNRDTAELNRKMAPLRDLLADLAASIAAGRCPLPEAASRMQAQEGNNPARLKSLKIFYPDYPVEQQFACWIYRYSLNIVENDAAARRLKARLVYEFYTAYGTLPPAILRKTE